MLSPRILVALLVALVLAPAAQAQTAPQNVRAFLLRANEPEPSGRTFARTPSFAWSNVRGATRYHFQLSTSQNFTDNAIVWEAKKLPSPLATVPITLPWITGSQYSFYARVRAYSGTQGSPWSARYGFRLEAPSAPASLSSGMNLVHPGMIRWTPVEGATSYEVLFLYDLGKGEKKVIRTATTAADLREYYTLHNEFPTLADIVWRVRAVREVVGKTTNRLPAVSYGPWSAYASTVEPGLTPGTVTPLGAISRSRASNVTSLAPGPGAAPHELVPGFWWSGDRSLFNLGECPPEVSSIDVTCPLFHVYVYTDEDCVNRVHTSDVVGSPAYVPRLTPPLQLPGSADALDDMFVPADPDEGTADTWFMLGDGEEGRVYDAADDPVYAAGTDPDLPGSVPAPNKRVDRRSGLWDNDWEESRYYWTVVPVIPRLVGSVEWHDVEFGQDMCEAGRLGTFGKTSAPATEKASGVPFVSGLAAGGSIRGASTDRPSFYGRALVAWRPAPGAFRYQIQWSRKADPFQAVGSVKTPSTSALLGLPTGVWYYRVRGIDHSIPGTAQGMTWSDPQYLKILPRSFVVLRRR